MIHGCILGAAGCGKSTLINKIMSQLKPTEYVSLAPTNKAARLIKKGQTINKFLASCFSNKSAFTKRLTEYFVMRFLCRKKYCIKCF